MNLTENDFINKMIEIAGDGPEFTNQLQCVFFTWNEFFNPENNAQRAFEVASQVFSASHPGNVPLSKNDGFWGEISCIL